MRRYHTTPARIRPPSEPRVSPVRDWGYCANVGASTPQRSEPCRRVGSRRARSGPGSTSTSRPARKRRGASTKRAEEIAARTVNKDRARAGESRTRSPASLRGKSSSVRGGQQVGDEPAEGSDPRAALRRGPAHERARALPHEQGAAATRCGTDRRKVDTPGHRPRRARADANPRSRDAILDVTLPRASCASVGDCSRPRALARARVTGAAADVGVDTPAVAGSSAVATAGQYDRPPWRSPAWRTSRSRCVTSTRRSRSTATPAPK